MYAFDLKRPTTIAQAVADLALEDAQALGGGQTLLPTMKQRLAAPEVLVALSGVAEMQGICTNAAGQICIGGGTTHAEVAHALADRYPALAELAGHIGDPAVRNRGTIGGSVANNDPAACYPAAVLGGNADVVTPTRTIPADDFFQGMFTTDLAENELITEVRFPVPSRAAYAKFVQPASRFALVGVFVADFEGAVRVAVTGASSEGVFRWTDAEAALSASFTPDALAGLQIDPADMVADIHADAAYRAHLVGVMTKRAVQAAR